jgi:phosphoribosylanthranilate isomerase
MGFIFYDKSPRNALSIKPDFLHVIPEDIRRTGVFVNSDFNTIMATATRFGLRTIQLHGNESPMLCSCLRSEGMEVIKAIPVSIPDDLISVSEYEGHCHYFLFDTRTSLIGGSGRQFNWDILNIYKGTTPFLLSGGIGASDVERISLLSHPMLAGLDINSHFELAPGIKSVSQIDHFIKRLSK